MNKLLVFFGVFIGFSSFASETDEEVPSSLLGQEKKRLVDSGDCIESDFLTPSGWKKSITLPQPSTYYVHCGSKNKIRTFYFNVKSEKEVKRN